MFKPEQLTQIKQASLGRVMCDSSDDIQEVTADVFKLPKLHTPEFIGCSQVPKVDLRLWTECCQGTSTKHKPEFRYHLDFEYADNNFHYIIPRFYLTFDSNFELKSSNFELQILTIFDFTQVK